MVYQKKVTYYGVRCDGCGAILADDEGKAILSDDKAEVLEIAQERDYGRLGQTGMDLCIFCFAKALNDQPVSDTVDAMIGRQ